MSETKGQGAGKPVCVTGASGYLGSHLVRELLERGYAVRGTVRDPNDAEKTAHLHKFADGAAGTLELVAADLTRAGSFDEAIDGCELVVHSAASVRLTAADPQRDIVDVAVNGTRNIFDSIEKVGGVKRLVMTSSVAAIVDDSLPVDYLFSEEDWNDGATLKDSPYPLSKTLSEREAWKRAEATGLELVTINPSFVMGPVYAKAHRRSSPAFVRDMLRGKPPFIPRFFFPCVDARDVANAHAEALHRADASGRYILSGRGAWLKEFADVLHAAHPKRPVPRRGAPNFVMYAAALFDKRLNWGFLRANLGVERRLDNRRSVEGLGIEYRPVDASLRDTAASLIDGAFV